MTDDKKLIKYFNRRLTDEELDNILKSYLGLKLSKGTHLKYYSSLFKEEILSTLRDIKLQEILK